jgi:hypothetical protein
LCHFSGFFLDVRQAWVIFQIGLGTSGFLSRGSIRGEGEMIKSHRLASVFAVAASFVVVQASDAQVFWSANGGANIVRSDLDGSNVTTVFTGSGIVGLAATDSYIYWVENAGADSGIWRAGHDGSNPDKYITGPFSGLQFLAVDEPGNRIFFSDWGQGLYQANLTTGGGVTSIGNPGITTDPTGRNTGVALAGPNQLISLAANAGDRNVYSTDISAGSNAALGQYAAASNQSYGLALVDNIAYITTLNHGNLSSYNLATNQSVQLLPNTSIGQALGVAVNPEQTHLYIVGRADGSIFTYDLQTGQLDTFLAGVGAHFSVAVIPEPATAGLLLGGIGLLGLRRRR